RALMQGQSGNVVEWANGQVVSVHHASLEPASPAGVKWRQRVRHRNDPKPAAGKLPEIIADDIVGPLGDVGRNAHQLVRRLRLELRVRLQEFEEFRKRSL